MCYSRISLIRCWRKFEIQKMRKSQQQLTKNNERKCWIKKCSGSSLKFRLIKKERDSVSSQRLRGILLYLLEKLHTNFPRAENIKIEIFSSRHDCANVMIFLLWSETAPSFGLLLYCSTLYRFLLFSLRILCYLFSSYVDF